MFRLFRRDFPNNCLWFYFQSNVMDTADREFVAPGVPEENGYVKSFDLSQGEELVKFFWKYGFVVIHDAIPPTDVQATIDDIWQKHIPNVDRNDPSSWSKLNWSSVFGSSYNTKRGFLGYEPGISLAAWNNRQNPTVYEAFSRIWGRRDLWVKLDRYGWNGKPNATGCTGTRILGWKQSFAEFRD